MKVLIISDVHGNKYVLEALESLSLDYDRIIFVGDAVDYGPHPDYCVDWLRKNADIWVMGNHDYAVAYNVDCRCGELTHELSVYTRENISFKLLDRRDIDYLRVLPHQQFYNVDSVSLYIVHGAPRDPLYAYLYPDLPKGVILELLKAKNKYGFVAGIPQADIFVVGHTHIPFDIEVASYRIVNPGSLGQPRDGKPLASVGVLDTDSGKFEILRIRYDIEKLLEDLREFIVDKNVMERLRRIYMEGRVS